MSDKHSGEYGRTWISAEISPELMEALERQAKARGISRSEGLRQALRQWTADGEGETRVAGDRRRQIVERLDELREEILLQLEGEKYEKSVSEKRNSEEASTDSGAKVYPAGLMQMQLYEGENATEQNAGE